MESSKENNIEKWEKHEHDIWDPWQASQTDEYFGRIVTLLGQKNLLEKEQKVVTNYTLDQGILYYKLCLCIPNINEIKAKILWEAYNSHVAGHCGYV